MCINVVQVVFLKILFILYTSCWTCQSLVADCLYLTLYNQLYFNSGSGIWLSVQVMSEEPYFSCWRMTKCCLLSACPILVNVIQILWPRFYLGTSVSVPPGARLHLKGQFTQKCPLLLILMLVQIGLLLLFLMEIIFLMIFLHNSCSKKQTEIESVVHW